MPEHKHRIVPDLLRLGVEIDTIQPHPENYNKHDLAKIKDSLTRNGQYRPIVVQQSTGHILAGNGTYAAARALGWTHIARTLVDVDEDAARRILLVDNFAATDEYDTEAVVKVLEELGGDLSGTGIEQAEFEKMLASLDGGNADEDGGDDSDSLSEGFHILVTCEDESQQSELLARFLDEGLECKAMVV